MCLILSVLNDVSLLIGKRMPIQLIIKIQVWTRREDLTNTTNYIFCFVQIPMKCGVNLQELKKNMQRKQDSLMKRYYLCMCGTIFCVFMLSELQVKPVIASEPQYDQKTAGIFTFF